MAPRFVKAADTEVSVPKSRMALEELFRRYGAVGFSVSQNYVKREATVECLLPTSAEKGATLLPIRIPVNIARVHHALYGDLRSATGRSEVERAAGETQRSERAERVAWRHLVLWADAALSAASVGVDTITNAFHAHRLVTTAEGTTERLADLLERSNGLLPSGVRALLTNPEGRDAKP